MIVVLDGNNVQVGVDVERQMLWFDFAEPRPSPYIPLRFVLILVEGYWGIKVLGPVALSALLAVAAIQWAVENYGKDGEAKITEKT